MRVVLGNASGVALEYNGRPAPIPSARHARWKRAFRHQRARTRRPRYQTEIELVEQIQPVRGMNDVLPAQIGAWQHLEDTVRELLTEYGFEEIRTPIVEHTELFKRAIGEFTDVVEKEMYTFTDQGEATA